MEKLKVSKNSNPKNVAGAIANIFRKERSVLIEVIGAGSLNQAIKAVAIARGFLITSGTNLVVTPSFCEVKINDINKTAIRLMIENK